MPKKAKVPETVRVAMSVGVTKEVRNAMNHSTWLAKPVIESTLVSNMWMNVMGPILNWKKPRKRIIDTIVSVP